MFNLLIFVTISILILTLCERIISMTGFAVMCFFSFSFSFFIVSLKERFGIIVDIFKFWISNIAPISFRLVNALAVCRMVKLFFY